MMATAWQSLRIANEANEGMRVEIEQLRAEIERLRVALKDCSESLAEEVEARFNAVKRHPSMQRQYNRDMTPVIEALKLLGD